MKMKKRIAMILALIMLAAWAAAAAGTGEIPAVGEDPRGAVYSEGDCITINDRETLRILRDAVNALEIGEKTEAPAEGVSAKLGFWFSDQSTADLFFEGHTLKTAEGETYTLRNGEALWKALDGVTDRSRLTVNVDGYPFILGESTPQNMIDTLRCDCEPEGDNTFGISCDHGATWIYIRTEHGQMDEPILTVNAMWTDAYIEYCGFDGIFSIGRLDDPDAVWSPDGYTVDERDYLIEDEGMSAWGHWEGLDAWLTERYGAAPNPDGITEAKIPLSDGRTVQVDTNGTPVCLSLKD